MSSPDTESVRAVSFDLGGTLITATPSVGAIYASVCGDHGLDVRAEACDRSFEQAWGRRSANVTAGRDRFSTSPGGENGWWRGIILDVLADCGIAAEAAPPIEAFRSAFASADAWKVFDDVVETLEALRAAGYRLAILSNWDSRMPLLLRHLGLSRYFDVVLCSALEGVEKPHRDFFRKVQTAIGVPPRRTLHVGDLVREDYQGARAAGMQALWLDRRGEARPAGGEVDPGDVVTSIADVARLLEARRKLSAPGEA